MKKIKKWLQKILLYLLKKLNMPEYTLIQVDAVTRCLQVSSAGNNEEVIVTFNTEDSYSVHGIISLYYSLHFNNDNSVFSIEVRYIKASGRIQLFSTGNSLVSFTRLIMINALLTNFYISFSERKDTILNVLENLPINR